MLLAAYEGGAQAVAAWLDEGGGVDSRCTEHQDRTLLMLAAAGGQEAMVRMLLQRGASINLQGSLGGTALMGAADGGHTAIVQALLDAKADASLKTMQALLDAKADASLQNNSGETALMIAEHYKHTATVQLLRQHAKRQTAEAKARAAASLVQATAAAEAAATELLGELEAEKEAARRGRSRRVGARVGARGRAREGRAVRVAPARDEG